MIKNPVNFTLLILILLISSNVFAKFVDTVYVHPDSIEEKFIKLDMPWRYHSGDSAIWAQPEFDDSKWDTVYTNLALDDSLEGFWKGMGSTDQQDGRRWTA